MTDFSTWYNGVPRFTRYWLTATLALSLIARMGLIDAQYLVLFPTFVFKKFQVRGQAGMGLASVQFALFGHESLSLVTDMATGHIGALLSDKPANRVPFHAELLLPLPVLKPSRTGPIQAKSRRLFLLADVQLALVRNRWSLL